MVEPSMQLALEKIQRETDGTIKQLMLASLCTQLFETHGIELIVVGGSAIEFYTEGAYTSGDIDLCVAHANQLPGVRQRQEIMGQIGAIGGPRSWVVGGLYVDVLGAFEKEARTPVRRLQGPFGTVHLAPPEELIVERVLIAVYPQAYPPARECAVKLIAAALNQEIEVDWAEVHRLSSTPAYANWSDVKQLVYEQAKTLQIRDPYHSHA